MTRKLPPVNDTATRNTTTP